MTDHLESEGLKPSDEAWLVVDKDQWTDEQLTQLHQWSLQQENYGFALSNPKFEYWLLLHFEDGTGIILSRMDGEWDGIVPGDITVKKGALTMQDKGISVPSADVTATGISLTGHTHTDSMGGSTSGPQ